MCSSALCVINTVHVQCMEEMFCAYMIASAIFRLNCNLYCQLYVLPIIYCTLIAVFLYTNSRDGTVTVWDLRIGQELWTAHDR